MAVSVWIFGIALVSYSFCEALVQAGLGEQSGPLVASLALFLAPGVGMGMVSPFAIRLAAQSVATSGRSPGTLYALSTLGSIVGTILTTFVLIPLIGLSAILKGLGLSLLIVSVFTLPAWRRSGCRRWSCCWALRIAGLAASGPQRRPHSRPDETLVWRRKRPISTSR